MLEDKDNNSAIDDRFENGRGAYASGSDDYDQESLNDSSNGDPSDEEKKLAETTGSSGSGWADKTNKSSADKISPKGGAMALLSGLSGKKKAGLIGAFGGGGLLVAAFLLFSQGTLFASLTQNATLTNDTATHVLQSRYNKKFYAMVEKSADEDSAKCNTAKCKRGRLSNKAILDLKKTGVNVISDGRVYVPDGKKGFPTKAITHYQIDGKTIGANDLKGFLAKNPNHAAKFNGSKGAFNIRFKNFSGKFNQSRFLSKFGINKSASIVKTLSKPYKTVSDKMKAVNAAIKEKVPSISKMAGFPAKIGALDSLKSKIAKGSRGGGVAFGAVVAGCAISKAPAIISGAAAAYELAQLVILLQETVLSPGSLSMAAGMYDKEGIKFSSEAADALGSKLTEKDENGKSALDSKFLLGGIGVNTGKTGVSKDYAPGYSVLTNPAVSTMDGIGTMASGPCNFILSPTGMYTGMALSSGLSKSTLIAGLVNQGVGYAAGKLGITDWVVDTIGGFAINVALDIMLEKDKLTEIRGEPLGDALGTAMKAFFSSQAMSGNVPVLSMESLGTFTQVKQDNEEQERIMDIASHSPLDITNRHTFMGSIYNNAKMAMILNGGLTSNVLGKLGAFARLPMTFASMATSSVGASDSVSVAMADCGYAKEFGLEGDTPAETPAINAAGLPCTGFTSQISSGRAEALLNEPGREWLKTDVEISEDATTEEYLNAVIGVNDEDWSTPLKDIYTTCSDASTGNYLYDIAGCMENSNFKLSTGVNSEFTDQISVQDGGGSKGSASTLTQLGQSYTGINNAGTSLATDAEALNAAVAFILDTRLEDMINGNDEEDGTGVAQSGAVSGDLIKTAVAFSWPDAKTAKEKPTPAYAEAITDLGIKGMDCGRFVGAVLRTSGVDTSFPETSTQDYSSYMSSHPEIYQKVTVKDYTELQPGDMLNSAADGHIRLYIGEDAATDGGGPYAEASSNTHYGHRGVGHYSADRFSKYDVFRIIKN